MNRTCHISECIPVAGWEEYLMGMTSKKDNMKEALIVRRAHMEMTSKEDSLKGRQTLRKAVYKKTTILENNPRVNATLFKTL